MSDGFRKVTDGVRKLSYDFCKVSEGVSKVSDGVLNISLTGVCLGKAQGPYQYINSGSVQTKFFFGFLAHTKIND